MRLSENNCVNPVAKAVLALFCLTGAASADVATVDPLFEKLAFDQWKTDKGQTAFKWTVDVEPVVLSSHQRWLAHVNVRIDGVELLSRRGDGLLLVLFQFQDAAGRVYQDHGSLDLRKVEAGAKSQIIIYTESAFVVPGNYPLSIGVYDTTSKDHWARRDSLKVPAYKNDPLPGAWRDLPTVEFMPPEEAPDSWFQPKVEGKLHLPLETRHPLKINVLVNLTPSERATGSQRIQDRNLSVLVPTLKVLASMEMTSGSLNVESLDLQRQKVTFRQSAARQLDWPKMRDALTADQLGTIDVKSLGDREHSVQFFIGEVGKRLRSADVLIILSTSVRFEAGMDMEPMHTEGVPDSRVYYIRYHPPPVRYYASQQPTMLSRRPPPPMLGRGPLVLGPNVIDQLEPTLKTLKHRLFDVQTPEEMRKAIADLMAELAAI